MTAYYNEIDSYAAQWLRNLIDAGHIAPGYVDERSILDVSPDDLRGFTQCHFFAGVGVWSLALRRAGWPDDRPVWTGSCPCQPFSAAGKGAGFDDERHVWPAWQHLIQQCKPAVVLGEQVASKDAGPWLDLVHDDLEDLGYAFGAVAFPSAGVGAPHIRDRLYWVANSQRSGVRGRGHGADAAAPGEVSGEVRQQRVRPHLGAVRDVEPDWLADTRCNIDRRETVPSDHVGTEVDGPADRVGGCGSALGGMANADDSRLERRLSVRQRADECAARADSVAFGLADDILQQRQDGQSGIGYVDGAAGWIEGAAAVAGLRGDQHAGPVNGLWRDADWLFCRDGKWRPVEPGTFPLAHGAPARVGRLRAYGNAINVEAARVFIECVMESL